MLKLLSGNTFLGIFLLSILSCGKQGPLNQANDTTLERPTSHMDDVQEAGDPQEDVLKSYLAGEAEKDPPHPGASKYGQVFDFGPRQAPLRGQLPESILLKSPISSCSSKATNFINMAFSYIHAFELIEAERFFRQAFAEDKNCIMALWGAGLTQVVFHSGDRERGKKFLKLAKSLRDHKNIQLTSLENELLEVTYNFLTAPYKDSLDKKKNELKFASELINLKNKFTNEIEIKALAVLFTWQIDYSMEAQKDINLTKEDLNKWLEEIFVKYPFHPANHYKIHLWNDSNNEEKAFESAKRNGRSFLNSAHMWHMAGNHFFAPLSEWYQAIDQINIASYLDQKNQSTALEFPYTIHNYDHNQNMSSKVYLSLGAFDLCAQNTKGFFNLPLHSKFNNPLNPMSFYEAGLLTVTNLVAFGAFKEAIEASKKATLSSENFKDKKILTEFYFNLAWAHTALDQEAEAQTYLSKIKELKIAKASLNKYEQSLRLFALWKKDKSPWTVNQLSNIEINKQSILRNITVFELYRQSSSAFDVLKKIQKSYNDDPLLIKKERNILVLLDLSWALAKLGELSKAREYFEEAQKISAYIKPNSELFKLGQEVHLLLGEDGNWTRSISKSEKLAVRIPKDWDISQHALPVAPDFNLKNSRDEKINLDKALQSSSKGILLVMVLGGSCARCNEQLNTLNKYNEKLESLGYKIYAITTDDLSSMKDSLKASEGDTFELKYPLLSDSSFSAFKAYRNFDDFEKLPLHGTYLISKEKKLQYIHRGALPFEDFELLLGEIKRLYTSN
jgi:peroxiredoxin